MQTKLKTNEVPSSFLMILTGTCGKTFFICSIIFNASNCAFVCDAVVDGTVVGAR